MTEPVVLPGSLSVGRNCFACGPDNPAGLHIPYVKVGDTVQATFTLGEQFSGASAYAHGGVVMTVLDEGMAWATIALRSRFALTQELTSTFRRPVLIGETYTLLAECSPLEADGRTLQVTGSISNAEGKVCTRAQGRYYAMTIEETAVSMGLPALPEEMLAVFGAS